MIRPKGLPDSDCGPWTKIKMELAAIRARLDRKVDKEWPTDEGRFLKIVNGEVAAADADIAVDDHMSSTSEHPVQNKVVNAAINNAVNILGDYIYQVEQDVAEKAAMLKGNTAPTTSTEADLGDFYLDTATGKLYQLKSIDNTGYQWEEPSGAQIIEVNPGTLGYYYDTNSMSFYVYAPISIPEGKKWTVGGRFLLTYTRYGESIADDMDIMELSTDDYPFLPEDGTYLFYRIRPWWSEDPPEDLAITGNIPMIIQSGESSQIDLMTTDEIETRLALIAKGLGNNSSRSYEYHRQIPAITVTIGSLDSTGSFYAVNTTTEDITFNDPILYDNISTSTSLDSGNLYNVSFVKTRDTNTFTLNLAASQILDLTSAIISSGVNISFICSLFNSMYQSGGLSEYITCFTRVTACEVVSNGVSLTLQDSLEDMFIAAVGSSNLYGISGSTVPTFLQAAMYPNNLSIKVDGTYGPNPLTYRSANWDQASAITNGLNAGDYNAMFLHAKYTNSSSDRRQYTEYWPGTETGTFMGASWSKRSPLVYLSPSVPPTTGTMYLTIPIYSLWLDTTNNDMYILVDQTLSGNTSTLTWKQFTLT